MRDSLLGGLVWCSVARGAAFVTTDENAVLIDEKYSGHDLVDLFGNVCRAAADCDVGMAYGHGNILIGIGHRFSPELLIVH